MSGNVKIWRSPTHLQAGSPTHLQAGLTTRQTGCTAGHDSAGGAGSGARFAASAVEQLQALPITPKLNLSDICFVISIKSASSL
ncbi:hypothetical protein [Thermoleptolyngbya sp. C42_A2020_037]|uniref:hypothetical protein n=1 Tax=Thermoleptolyngbya sp. C42_A2020_037 TaxID=2747799 RepID=UPI0019E9546C|nr:hypothetical protein [Thermoleptolyngbya sp. C42_A2020_037]MBF2085139.1 hypothetical protein [Thermoleptolyngbya sp. C42_A2020_037]